MADFASYRERQTDALQIINLDQVGQIITDNDADDSHIIFAKFHTPERDATGKALNWWRQPSNQLMIWKFTVAATGKSAAEVKNIRDAVLDKLLKGERHFALYRYAL